MLKYILPVFFLGLMSYSCSRKVQTNNVGGQLDTLLTAYYEERLMYYPLEATAIADNRYNDKLPCDIADSYRDTLRDFYNRYLTALDAIDTNGLDAQSKLSFKVFKREMAMQIEGLGFQDNLMPINQFWGMPLTFALLGSGGNNQPFHSVKDYDDFLGRIRGYAIWTDTAIANMKRGMAQGIVPPRILMERVLPQLKAMLVEKPEASVFYQPITNLPDSLPEAAKKRLTEAYKLAIMNQVVPAYRRLHDFISQDYMQACRTSTGISEVPGGKAFYQYQARFWTTTDLTPDEIFEIGQNEVKRIRSEMERVKDQVGFKGDLKAFFKYIHEDPRFRPFKKDTAVITAYRAIEGRMQPQLKKLFNLVPKARFEVRQTEKFREASASAEYNQSAPDGSRPGIFFVPVPDPTKINVVGMEDLFLHEAIPGHHYQTSIQQENESLPKFRRFGWYGAYGEGWALYTESLGKELGLYSDPYQYFGCLSEEMHRALRLVVDVGMHWKGMTREEAIQLSLDNEAESEAEITTEIERYMAIPGQALGYKIGQMKIREVRAKAEKELGSKFNIASFHDAVLIDGCLPLDVFEQKMNTWIQSEKAKN